MPLLKIVSNFLYMVRLYACYCGLQLGGGGPGVEEGGHDKCLNVINDKDKNIVSKIKPSDHSFQNFKISYQKMIRNRNNRVFQSKIKRK